MLLKYEYSGARHDSLINTTHISSTLKGKLCRREYTLKIINNIIELIKNFHCQDRKF
jgi:hypothetical protein